MAAIAQEIRYCRGERKSDVVLAAGLPLASFGREKKGFREYLFRKECVDEIIEQVLRNTGLSVTDIQIERVLNGQSCSMDPAAKEIIVRQGRLYTEKILSAIMEARFDLKAIPSVIMGGGASILKRHVTPQDGLCRQIYLTDVHVYERIVGQMCAK